VLLVRHSLPEVDPSRPAEEWTLSDEGRARCAPLAARLGTYAPEGIISSTEPKARETAELIGAELGLEVGESPALCETARRTVPWLEPESFRRAMQTLFERPDDVVFGEESAAHALARFSAVAAGVDERTIVVSHGTVISLYAAERTGEDPFAIWSRLELPDLLVI
jgi:broad specificity phosphatase PhoE